MTARETTGERLYGGGSSPAVKKMLCGGACEQPGRRSCSPGPRGTAAGCGWAADRARSAVSGEYVYFLSSGERYLSPDGRSYLRPGSGWVNSEHALRQSQLWDKIPVQLSAKKSHAKQKTGTFLKCNFP